MGCVITLLRWDNNKLFLMNTKLTIQPGIYQVMEEQTVNECEIII